MAVELIGIPSSASSAQDSSLSHVRHDTLVVRMDSVFNLLRAVVNSSESIPLSTATAPPSSDTEQPFNDDRRGTLDGAVSEGHLGNETRNVAEQEGAVGEQPIRKESDACGSTEIGSAESDGDGNDARTEEANVEPDVQVAAAEDAQRALQIPESSTIISPATVPVPVYQHGAAADVARTSHGPSSSFLISTLDATSADTLPPGSPISDTIMFITPPSSPIIESIGTSGFSQVQAAEHDQHSNAETSVNKKRINPRGCKGRGSAARHTEKWRSGIAEQMEQRRARGAGNAAAPRRMASSQARASEAGVDISVSRSSEARARATAVTSGNARSQRLFGTYEAPAVVNNESLHRRDGDGSSFGKISVPPLISTSPVPGVPTLPRPEEPAAYHAKVSGPPFQPTVPSASIARLSEDGRIPQIRPVSASSKFGWSSYKLVSSTTQAGEGGGDSDSSSTTDPEAYRPPRQAPRRRGKGKAKRAKHAAMEKAIRDKTNAEQDGHPADGVAGPLSGLVFSSDALLVPVPLNETLQSALATQLTNSTTSGSAARGPARESFASQGGQFPAAQSRGPANVEGDAASVSSGTMDAEAYKPAKKRRGKRSLKGKAKIAKQLEKEQALREKDRSTQNAQQLQDGVVSSSCSGQVASISISGPGTELLWSPHQAGSDSSNMPGPTRTIQALAQGSFRRQQADVPAYNTPESPQSGHSASRPISAPTSRALLPSKRPYEADHMYTAPVASLSAGDRHRAFRGPYLGDHEQAFRQSKNGVHERSEVWCGKLTTDDKRRKLNEEISRRMAALNAPSASSTNRALALAQALQQPAPNSSEMKSVATTSQPPLANTRCAPTLFMRVRGEGERRLDSSQWTRPSSTASGEHKGKSKQF